MTDRQEPAARVAELFHLALALEPAARAAWLTSLDEPAEVLGELSALLSADRLDDLPVDRGIGATAAALLASGGPADLPVHPFGPYRVIALLGEGGMGTVFRATRASPETTVAIKVLRDSWLSPARRARFVDEERLLAQLGHPGIARFLDAGVLPDGTPWFAMEYVEGAVPITRYCEAGRLPLAARLRLIIAAAAAAHHAHQRAIIHRDLKPSNILVGADGRVRVVDFGIAKQVEASWEGESGTLTGLRLMTPAYAAPEQRAGDPVGAFTDVYALGAVLYQLLTGTPPYGHLDGTDPAGQALSAGIPLERPSARFRAAGTSAPPLGPVRKGEWADLDVLVLKALHPDPDRRYGSAEAMAEDLERFLAGEPLTARPDGFSYRAGKFLRRNRGPVAVATVALTAIVALTAWYTASLAAARREAEAEAVRVATIQRFTQQLFTGGDELLGPADSLRVVTLLDRGRQEAALLDDEPVIQADLYATLGDIYRKLGELPVADSLLTLALERRTALAGAAAPDRLRSILALAALRLDQAEHASAAAMAREVLAMAPRDPVIEGEAHLVLGTALQQAGDYDASTTELELAAAIHRRRTDGAVDLATTLNELSNTHFYAGRFAAADSLSRAALTITEKLHGPDHPLVASDLVNLGAVQFEWGRYDTAEVYYRRGLAITEGWYGAEHPRTAANLTMLGRALVRLERFEEADSVLQRALTIHERTYGPVHPRVASTINELGTVAGLRGDLDVSESRYRRMLAIYHEVYGPEHYLPAIAASNIANVHLLRRDYPRAEREFRDVVALFTRTLSADHLNTGIAQIKLGRTLVRQRKWREAEQVLLAGYATVSSQTDPGVSWLVNAREDLVATYEALGNAGEAARYRMTSGEEN